MKTLIILLMGFSLTACSSIPPLFDWAKPSGVTKTWHVHPDDQARFKVDRQHCWELAVIAHGDDRTLDACLQQLGYQLEITSN